MSEQMPFNTDTYKAHLESQGHETSYVVDDLEKARLEALAGDAERSVAAIVRSVGEDIIEAYINGETSTDRLLVQYADEGEIGIAKTYHLERVSTDGRINEQVIDIIAAVIEQGEYKADQKESEVGKRYDLKGKLLNKIGINK